MTQVSIELFTDPACPFAFSAEPVRQRLRWHYGEGLRWTPRMIVALAAELAVTRSRGYAIDDCESNIAVRCVAVPVRNASGMAVAAISVSVPTVRWRADTQRHLADLVRQAGSRLSRHLGAAIDAIEVA